MWINVNTGGVFTLHADIRHECWKNGIELPGILTDEVLAPHGYMPVKRIPQEYDPVSQGLSALPPISNEGQWEQHFVVIDLDPAIVANNAQMVLALTDNAKRILQEGGLLASTVANLKDRKWEAIKRERDRRKAGGVNVGGLWFHSDVDSRVQWLGLKDTARDMLAAGAVMSDPIMLDGQQIMWKSMSGAWAPVTVSLALQVVQATKELDGKAFKAAEVHRATMEASDPTTYSFSAGWPAIYGEAA